MVRDAARDRRPGQGGARGLLLSPGMKSLLALPLVLLSACASDEGTSASSLTQPPGQCGEIETHVFGIYSAPAGKATVHIARPGRHALVVSAHDATTWTITAGDGAVIEGVYAVGIAAQTVKAPAGTKVESESRETGGAQACGYSWPYDGQGCDTRQLLNLTSKIINHGATSFHGCQVAGSFVLGEDMAVTSSCDVPLAEFASCEGPDSCGGPILL